MFAVFVAVIVLLIWEGSGPRPPKYQGKSLSELIDNSGYPHSAYIELVGAVRTLGEEAVPYLAHILENEPTLFQRSYSRLYSFSPAAIRAYLPYPASSARRSRAAAQLRNAGSNAVSVIPLLVRISREDQDWTTRANALSSLEKLGPGSEYSDLALDAMLAGTRGGPVVQSALGGLGAFTNKKEVVIPVLLDGMDNPITMHIAATALKRLGSEGVEAAREKIKAGGIPIFYVPEIEQILSPPGTMREQEPVQTQEFEGMETFRK